MRSNACLAIRGHQETLLPIQLGVRRADEVPTSRDFRCTFFVATTRQGVEGHHTRNLDCMMYFFTTYPGSLHRLRSLKHCDLPGYRGLPPWYMRARRQVTLPKTKNKKHIFPKRTRVPPWGRHRHRVSRTLFDLKISSRERGRLPLHAHRFNVQNRS